VPTPSPHRGSRSTSTRPGPAPSLTVSGIAAAAVGLADAGGLPAVTMRTVATALGMTAPALYRYLSSRDELVAHMVDLVSAAVEYPPPSGDWVHDLTVVAEHQRRLFRAHPWLAGALSSAHTLGPHVLDHLDWGLAVLRDVDASPTRKMEAIALANGIAALFSATVEPVGPDAFSHLDPERHPRLAQLLAAAAPTPPAEDIFPRVVEGALRGLLADGADDADA
jgi:AcrR family transcriptional regulator